MLTAFGSGSAALMVNADAPASRSNLAGAPHIDRYSMSPIKFRNPHLWQRKHWKRGSTPT